ncbi:hypothetical protein BT63DRAFT_476578 [Microthyrium microscopicum]|uniref:Uncharacterized protein n=1 Tax=Microthyrium microscopicum TaxID=703497 RepID=A0A6A6UKW3_9PEZI|nr:hypothetical protein BT63DRAFT_476578 [Microthyrium microscopicum]
MKVLLVTIILSLITLSSSLTLSTSQQHPNQPRQPGRNILEAKHYEHEPQLKTSCHNDQKGVRKREEYIYHSQIEDELKAHEALSKYYPRLLHSCWQWADPKNPQLSHEPKFFPSLVKIINKTKTTILGALRDTWTPQPCRTFWWGNKEDPSIPACYSDELFGNRQSHMDKDGFSADIRPTSENIANINKTERVKSMRKALEDMAKLYLDAMSTCQVLAKTPLNPSTTDSKLPGLLPGIVVGLNDFKGDLLASMAYLEKYNYLLPANGTDGLVAGFMSNEELNAVKECRSEYPRPSNGRQHVCQFPVREGWQVDEERWLDKKGLA